MRQFYYLQRIEADWVTFAFSSDITFLRKTAEEKGFVYWRIINKRKRVLLMSPKLLEVKYKRG